MFKNSKSQSSVEYLFIIGISFTIMMIISTIFLNFSNENKDKIEEAQINKISDLIISEANKIYFLEENSKTKIETIFPENLINISIRNFNFKDGNDNNKFFNYLNFTYISENTKKNIIKYPDKDYIKLTCSINCSNISKDGTPTKDLYFNQNFIFTSSKKNIILEKKNDKIDISIR